MNYKDNDASTFDGEKSNPLINDEFGQTGKLHFKSPNKEIEIQRYKQDCRKRALELAYNEWDAKLTRQIRGKEKDSNVEPEPFNISETADKYYNWLINIPQ